jgi:hypothetical protein
MRRLPRRLGARMSERETALFGTWRVVNEIADATEDAKRIRAIIAEAGIQPNMHVGTDPEAFTPSIVAEWVLGQWADMIDSDSPYLNSARNISHSQYEKVVGTP